MLRVDTPFLSAFSNTKRLKPKMKSDRLTVESKFPSSCHILPPVQMKVGSMLIV